MSNNEFDLNIDDMFSSMGDAETLITLEENPVIINPSEMDFDFNESDVEVLGSIKNESGRVIPFDDRFYVSYGGLNPLTILKEDISTLITVLKNNISPSKIEFMCLKIAGSVSKGVDTVTFEGFIDSMQRRLADILGGKENSDEIKSRATEICDSFIQNWSRLEMFIRDIMFSHRNIGVSLVVEDTLFKADGNPTSSVIDPRRKKRLFKDLLINPNKELIDYLVGSYNLYLEIIGVNKGSRVHVSRDKAEGREPKSDREIIEEYKSKDYTYSAVELSILKKLGFPIACAGNEHFLKSDTSINTDKSDAKYNSIINKDRSLISALWTIKYLHEDSAYSKGYIPF